MIIPKSLAKFLEATNLSALSWFPGIITMALFPKLEIFFIASKNSFSASELGDGVSNISPAIKISFGFLSVTIFSNVSIKSFCSSILFAPSNFFPKCQSDVCKIFIFIPLLLLSCFYISISNYKIQIFQHNL